MHVLDSGSLLSEANISPSPQVSAVKDHWKSLFVYKLGNVGRYVSCCNVNVGVEDVRFPPQEVVDIDKSYWKNYLVVFS